MSVLVRFSIVQNNMRIKNQSQSRHDRGLLAQISRRAIRSVASAFLQKQSRARGIQHTNKDVPGHL